jgi:hypothetical protein
VGSRRLPTAAARIRSNEKSCDICCEQSGTVVGFLRVLRFPLPILIPPTHRRTVTGAASGHSLTAPHETVRYGIQQYNFLALSSNFVPIKLTDFRGVLAYSLLMSPFLNRVSFLTKLVKFDLSVNQSSIAQGRNGSYHKSGQRHLAYSPFQVRSKSVTTAEKYYKRTEIQMNMFSCLCVSFVKPRARNVIYAQDCELEQPQRHEDCSRVFSYALHCLTSRSEVV